MKGVLVVFFVSRFMRNFGKWVQHVLFLRRHVLVTDSSRMQRRGKGSAGGGYTAISRLRRNGRGGFAGSYAHCHPP